MKLVYESGSDKGKEIELNPPFISFGRETDNDVLLTEEEASRYHAKVEKDGIIWIVRDLDSSNGVRLNGQKIEESAPIENGDELRIGGSIFTVLNPDAAPVDNVSQAAAAPTDAVGRAPQEKPVKKGNDAGQKRVRLMMVALIAMVVASVSVLLLKAPPPAKKNTLSRAQVQKLLLKRAPLEIAFKHEKSGFDTSLQRLNLSIYEATIRDHKLFARVENVHDGVSIRPEPIELSEDEEAELKNELLGGDEFINAESLPEKERENSYERLSLMIRAGSRGNVVEYVNEGGLVPLPVTDAIDKIKRLVERKLDIPLMTADEAFKRAQELYLQANRNYIEKRVHPLNLYKAIQAVRAARIILNSYKKTPPYYRKLQELEKTCKEEHALFISDMKKKAMIEERTDKAKALERYKNILNHVEDINDADYRAARAKVSLLEARLQKERR